MSEHTDKMDARQLMEWLLVLKSRDEIHETIRSWLRANPPPATLEQHSARVGEMLAGWYQLPDGYDARIVGPALDDLADIAARIVRESGEPGAIDEFDPRRWVSEWANTAHPALGGQCPIHLMQTPEGIDQVRRLLEQSQSGAYA